MPNIHFELEELEILHDLVLKELNQKYEHGTISEQEIVNMLEKISLKIEDRVAI